MSCGYLYRLTTLNYFNFGRIDTFPPFCFKSHAFLAAHSDWLAREQQSPLPTLCIPLPIVSDKPSAVMLAYLPMYLTLPHDS